MLKKFEVVVCFDGSTIDTQDDMYFFYKNAKRAADRINGSYRDLPYPVAQIRKNGHFSHRGAKKA